MLGRFDFKLILLGSSMVPHFSSNSPCETLWCHKQNIQTSGVKRRDQVVKAAYLLNKYIRHCVVLDIMWKSVTEPPLLNMSVFSQFLGMFPKENTTV